MPPPPPATALVATVFPSGFCNNRVLRKRVIGPQPNPQPGGPGDHTWAGLYPSTSSACVALLGVKDPADIALQVIETHKPLHHGKVVVPLEW